MESREPYNPLEKVHLGESVASALLKSATKPLSDTKNLQGAGVYALYYVGDFRPYAPITDANIGGVFGLPIYVGRAVPEGSRKGGLTFDSSKGRAIRERLSQHASSIGASPTLQLKHFYYRSLVVDDIWIPLGENVLIEKFQPLWNRVIDGFGNKNPGRGRSGSRQSQWDTIHPGRQYVRDLELTPNPLSAAEIFDRIKRYFDGRLKESEKLALEEEV